MFGIKHKKIKYCMALLCIVLACDEKVSDPPRKLFITSMWAGGFQIMNVNSARGGAPFFINFSTTINQATATGDAISIKRKGIPIGIDIEPLPEMVVVKPIKPLLDNTPYTIDVNKLLFSKDGISMESNFTVEFTTFEPNGLYFYEVVDAPTSSEKIKLKNNSAYEISLTNWSIVNKSNSKTYVMPFNAVIPAGQFITISHETLSFEIADQDEELSLLQNGTKISSWHN